MADATTTRYGFVKPEVGASSDTWGAKWNTNNDDYDALLGAITTTGSSNAYVLTTGLSLAAYVTGQTFKILASFSNSSTVTINVDGLGAKAITKNGTTALASGDIVSGNIYLISYDGTRFQLVGATATGVFQTLDATLTALAALSWSSGNALLQFTAADTVSLTLAPSVTSVTASNSTSATTAAGTFTNTTNAASVRALVIEGNRATMANDDLVYVSFALSDSAGNQDEFCRISGQAPNVTSGAEAGELRFGVIQSGSIVNELSLTATALRPLTNDGLALGTISLGFSDAHLASGGVINWANGTYTLTQSGAALEASGTFRARVALSSETTTPTTAGSANKKMVLTGGATINTGTADDFYFLDPGTSARTITRGSGMTMYLNGTDSATATLAANQLGAVHYRSASVVVLSGAFS